MHVGMGQMENALMILRAERSPNVMPPVPSEGEISPLRFATVEMTRGALANIVISSGDACRYGADGKRFDDTLSREIFQRNAARTIRGDFSTPQRFRRNDERGARQHRHLERRCMSVWGRWKTL